MRILGVFTITMMIFGCGTFENKNDTKKENPSHDNGELLYPVSEEDRDMPFTMIVANKGFAVGGYFIANGEITAPSSSDDHCRFTVSDKIEPGHRSKVNALSFDENENGRLVMDFGSSSKTLHKFTFGKCILNSQKEFRMDDLKTILGDNFRLN